MRVRILLLSLLCIFSELLSAKTIYLLVFTDDNDQSIGTSCAQTHKFFNNTFVPNLRQYTGMTVNDKYYSGSRFSVSNVNSAISGLNSTSGDVIIFYYAGHGYNRGYNDYPTMTLGVSGTPIAQRSKDLLDVYNSLRRKPHQLLLCIAEACNAVHHVNGIADNTITSFPSHVFSAEHFKELFNASGDYMASSSIKGQKSYSSEGSPGMFTCGFREAFNEVVERSNTGTATWRNVFIKTIANTEHIALESGYTQQPQWISGAYVQDDLRIHGVEVAGLDANENVIGSYGGTIYASDVARLSFKINYSSTKAVNLTYKLTNSEKTYKNDESPTGYTWNVNLTSGNSKTTTHNWGWKNPGNYKADNYTYELFYNGKSVYRKTFTLYRKQGETGYLTVDNKTETSSRFSSGGGIETFTVKTDGSSYEVKMLPSWCTITSKNAGSFTIRCEANTSTSSRSDWFQVKSGDKTVRINVSQSGNSNTINASFTNVWVEHNVVQYVGLMAVKGMKIHAKFNVNNMLNKQGLIQAYFAFQNGNVLNDFNGQYRAPNGQVSVWGNFTPNYVNCTFNDYVLFMPYSELHCSGGTNYLKFHMELFEKTSGSWRSMASSSAINFTYTGF